MLLRRTLILVVASVTMLLSTALPAFAHVTVDPDSAPKGGEITLGFRVPNEEATAGTVKVQIFFPSDHPILGIDPESVPGWTDAIVTSALNPPVTTDDGTISSYVSEVTWSGGPIAVGHFMEFHVLAQTLPSDTDQVAFKALQTYADGTVVRWIDPVTTATPSPDHPTPILQLTGGAGGTASSAEPSSSIAASEQPRASGGSTASGSSKNNILSVVALIVGLVGVAIGTVGLVVARRRPTVNPLSP